MKLPVFARGLCDDAAVFPPGSLPLADAVPAHRAHEVADYAELVGPLVLPATALPRLADLLTAAPAPADTARPLNLVVTAPAGPDQLPTVFAAAAELPVTLRGVEVALPPDQPPPEFFAALDAAARDVPIWVEIPRDERGPETLRGCTETGRYLAKFRTGGVRAELYPDPAELADSIHAAVAAGVPFKATAGLHHAIRNTDPTTGFHQHGFLNLLLATDAAVRGAAPADLAAHLANRDAATVAAKIANWSDDRATAARAAFRSFGTCSVLEPLAELTELHLVNGDQA